jgi:4-methyl-5(b-hydroxyethyl)-thiazole monophosphate biosynthesis
MAKVFVFLANGFEEIEALAPVDIFRRCGVEIMTVSITASRSVQTSHGVTVEADCHISDADLTDADLLILPGGMPGASNLLESEPVRNALIRQNEEGRLIGAICAAPMVLGELGLLKGKRATCYPGFEQHFHGAEYTAEMVTVDGNITTGKGPGAAMAFGYQLLSNFVSAEKVEEIKKSMIYQG